MDAASTSEAVGFITLMQELKRKVRSWEQKVEVRTLYQNNLMMYSTGSVLLCVGVMIPCAETSQSLKIKPQFSDPHTHKMADLCTANLCSPLCQNRTKLFTYRILTKLSIISFPLPIGS